LLIPLAIRDQDAGVFEHLRVIADLAKLAEQEDPLVGSAAELAAKLGLPGERPEYVVANALRAYAFETKSVRIRGKPAYRYELTRKELQEILLRYGGEDSSQDSVTTPDPFDGVLV
jgi:hypothetical protein